MSDLTILMATYNGEKFLKEQLNSFNRQTYQNWELWVSDDGSTDETLEILRAFSEESGHSVVVSNGPKSGFVANFLSLTCNCNSGSKFFAFSDQDDIWNNDKLENAVQFLESVPDNVPALYCSRTEIVDQFALPTNPATYSPLMKLSPSFSNALVQSIAGGNTMVINRAAKKLLEEFGGVISVPSHDWWLYLIVTGVGGVVFYDPRPSLLYRQHHKNIVGSNRSFIGLFSRLVNFFFFFFQVFNNKNVYYLCKNISKLTPENQSRLLLFKKAKEEKGLSGLVSLVKSGAKRNGFLFNLALRAGAVIGRI